MINTHKIVKDMIGKNRLLDKQENVLCPNCAKKTYTLIDTNTGLYGTCKNCKYKARYD